MRSTWIASLRARGENVVVLDAGNLGDLGERAMLLVRMAEENDFSMGCFRCHSFVAGCAFVLLIYSQQYVNKR